MIKQKVLTLLVLLITVVTGAWAGTVTVTFNSGDISSLPYTKDGVTMTYSGTTDFSGKDFFGGSGTFTTDLGNFTRIETTGEISGTGWSGNTWTGNANSVSFTELWGSGQGFTITFTIEAPNPTGSCGNGVIWEMDNGVLSISYVGSGTGAMENYADSYYSPWASYLSTITSIVIESGVTSIGNCAFDQCPSLASVTIPASVTSIGYGVFLSCTNLASVTIPAGVTSIGWGVFYDCTKLATVTVYANPTCTLKDDVFTGCSSLEAIYVPGSKLNDFKTAEGWNAYASIIAAIPVPYTVALKDGTEDAGKWTIEPTEATTTGVEAGTKVTATYGGALKVKSVKAKKIVKVTSITLNKTETEITAGEKETLSVAEVLPDNAKDKSVTWSSGNMSVATVNAETGEVTAKAAGTAYITATANDGSGVQSSCKVTVRNPTLADVFTDGAVVCVAVKNEYETYTVTGTYSGGSYTNLSQSAKYRLFNFSMTKDGNNLVVWMERTPSSKCTITFNTQDNTYALTLEEDGEPDELSLSELVSITVKGVDITSTLEEVILTTVTWDSSNSTNLGAFSSEPYTNEGITLSINGDRNVANWLYYNNGEGIYFWLYESGDFTFTAPSGKKFTKIEMTVNAADKWSDAAENNKLGSGWPSGNAGESQIAETNKVTWTGTTASTVSLLAGASDFNEVPPVTSIVFTLMHPKLISLTVDDPNNTVGGAKSIYYFKGETWSQAIDNHPTENDGWWSTEMGVDYHGSRVWDESKSAPVSPSETIKTDGSYYFN